MIVITDPELKSGKLHYITYEDLKILVHALDFYILHCSKSNHEAERLYIKLYDFYCRIYSEHSVYLDELLKRLINEP